VKHCCWLENLPGKRCQGPSAECGIQCAGTPKNLRDTKYPWNREGIPDSSDISRVFLPREALPEGRLDVKVDEHGHQRVLQLSKLVQGVLLTLLGRALETNQPRRGVWDIGHHLLGFARRGFLDFQGSRCAWDPCRLREGVRVRFGV
jgi:hypothetical protein